MTKVVDDDRARQGKPGRPVLYVLVASLVLAGIYLATMVGWSGVSSPPAPGAQTQSGTPSASSSTSSGVPAGNPAYPAPATPSTGTQGGTQGGTPSR